MPQPFESVHFGAACVIAIEAQEMSPQLVTYTKYSRLGWRLREQESRSSLTDRVGQRPR